MVNKRNVQSEFDLYEPMRLWLNDYLTDKYRNYEIITVDAHSERLDKVLNRYGIVNDTATGVDIQIDVLGIARNSKAVKLFFIEAFLMTSADLGSLNKLLNTFKREDLLDIGEGKRIKKMKVAVWNLTTNAPEAATMVPKI